jgi:hypothetical protein
MDLGLLCLTTGFLPFAELLLPLVEFRVVARAAVVSTAVHVFGVTTPLVQKGSGSGDFGLGSNLSTARGFV